MIRSSTSRVALSQLNRAIAVRSYSSGDHALDVLPKAFKLEDLPLDIKRQRYPKIGNRDIVGPGMNQNPSYLDQEDFPMPAVRWAPNTDEVVALRQKEKGDWKQLTLAEKKQLYRNSYRQTFSEMGAPTGEWKRLVAATLYVAAFTTLGHMFHMYCFPEPEKVTMTTTPEHYENVLVHDLALNRGFATGLAAKYDFEKGQWK